MPKIDPIVLTVDNVRKTYPNGIEAVRGISMEVRPGEVFGLVGPNGAGKTTLLKIISGLLYPETGEILCGNANVTSKPKVAARYVGLMPDPLGVYTDICARDYLDFFARILDIPPGLRGQRIDRAVEMLELEPWLNEEVETLSAGWQRRLALGRILLTDAPILLLDEPAAGLDISSRSELLRIVRKLAETQRTLIVSSHILPELQQLADRFGIISKGQWIHVAPDQVFFSRDELTSGLGTLFWQIRCNDPVKARNALEQAGFELIESAAPGTAFKAEDESAAARALQRVIKTGVEVYEYRRHEMELSELVLKTLGDNGGEP